MPVARLKQYLDEKGVSYTAIQHAPAYTAQELAEAAHVCGNRLAKTVIVMLDGKMAMIVLRATAKIRWDRLCNELGTDFIELADEEEFADKFPDCEIGALPPFGKLYGMQVYMDEKLANEPEIAFCAGTHAETIRMATKDYLELAKPIVISRGFMQPDATPPLQRIRPGRQQFHLHP
ncbi:YbaK/EbsC family protein [Hahella sp. SMD15-11]|uniref:YbaK/EbsC family protein n=1 Tax=Thermohahella caldifontis TaxID=3142973 RepID=A0AB39URQ6_9GAMM